MKLRILIPTCILLLILLGLLKASIFVYADDQVVHGFTSFEEGTDEAVIRDTIPGLHFTNTNGQDWIYGDWRTGKYNGKYPDGMYTSNGNFFAWLGTAQGSGRIDFTGGNATYLSVWVSANEPVQLTAYYAGGQIADIASLDAANTNTGQLANLKVTAPFPYKIQYVIISGTANRWLIDDLSTDADGVPDQRIPVIFLPGVGGSKLENDIAGHGNFFEVWPNVFSLVNEPDDAFLNVLRLKPNGKQPFLNTPEYTTVRTGDIIRREAFNFSDVYGTTVDYFTLHGYTEDQDFFVCPYDWRKDIQEIASGSLDKTLDGCVKRALETNPKATQVNILAHSMGGLVARTYISNATKAKTIKRLITLGTPYLGAPKVALGVIDKLCFVEKGACLSNPDTIHNLVVNFPSAYQLAPSDAYFEIYPQGYIRRDRDLNQDGVNDGPLSVAQSYSMLAVHNQTLPNEARTFMSTIKGWDGGTNGVEVYVIVGDQHGTPITIVEEEKTSWYNPWATPKVVYRIEEIKSGDGTVPLHSADMRFPSGNVDLSGGTSVFYFKADHGGLPLDTSLLQLAIDIFASGAPSASSTQPVSVSSSDSSSLTLSDGGILRNKTVQASSISTTPRTQPLPLNGHLITLDGPVTIGVFDDQGNYIGSLSGSENFPNLIPGADYYELSSSAAVFLQNRSTYDVRIYGHDNASTDVRIQKVVDDELAQTALYSDLPVTNQSIAQLIFDSTASTPGNFALDQNGDGVQDTNFPPTSVLDPVESQDHAPPQTAINVKGETTLEGWYVGQVDVTMVALDNEGGTGVAKLEYSLDNGMTVQTYTGPFTVNTNQVNTIFAKATDRVGNEESPLANVNLRPPTTELSGDCNADRAITASDVTALALEFFDGDDNSNPLATSGGSYAGSPACDANEDSRIGASDVTCIARLFFNGPGACRTAVTTASTVNPSLTLPTQIQAAAGGQVTVPITLNSHDTAVGSLLFSLDYDETWLHFDPTDSDDNGIPDAITFNLPTEFVTTVTFDPNDGDGELDFTIGNFAATPVALPDGALATVTLAVGQPAVATTAGIRFAQTPAASFGHLAGREVAGTTADGAVVIGLQPANPSPNHTIYLPLISERQ